MEQRTDGEELGMSFQEIFETAIHADPNSTVTVSTYSNPSSIESEESSYFHFVGDVQPSPALVSTYFLIKALSIFFFALKNNV